MKEFDLIKRFFAEQPVRRKDVHLGIGDDCALVSAGEQHHIAVTTDTLVAGVHFFEDADPRAIGHKSLAVSLSDLAAMGAEPSWISLAISMPSIDEHWVRAFCTGVFELSEYYNVQLIGGDTTAGPLSITVTAQGLLPANKALSRGGAVNGDWLYVTGELGDAALALQFLKGNADVAREDQEALLEKLHYPKPRVLAGQILKEYASAAIDLSDGLLGDLGHICQASQLGANVVLDDLPISNALSANVGAEQAREFALAGGDDYELLFTVSQDNKVGMETALSNAGVKYTCIGQLNKSMKITTTLDSHPVPINAKGFEHFSEASE
ncbi:thiamine-phosphate kinase [Thalassotalea euphylliae]|uniref:Thiamine-monophosphate kinase n=1 Tax=Thalassotalea euphylliae TaxID=1655234 RepID=A0A3E0TNG0_9GAMM|nr:thiamine-phosphate kinase [Thalassotalea euphylliae]REL26141.1 thiamine-phosphate kinase [Thalassotalea euphylliae]